MSISRSLPAQRVPKPALGRATGAYDFDVVADLPLETGIVTVEANVEPGAEPGAEPGEAAAEQALPAQA
jgi:hypothetical protein